MFPNIPYCFRRCRQVLETLAMQWGERWPATNALPTPLHCPLLPTPLCCPFTPHSPSLPFAPSLPLPFTALHCLFTPHSLSLPLHFPLPFIALCPFTSTPICWEVSGRRRRGIIRHRGKIESGHMMSPTHNVSTVFNIS